MAVQPDLIKSTFVRKRSVRQKIKLVIIFLCKFKKNAYLCGNKMNCYG